MISNRAVLFFLFVSNEFLHGYAGKGISKLDIGHLEEFNTPESPKEQILRHRHKHDENGSRTSDSSYSASEDGGDNEQTFSVSTPLRPGYALRGIDPTAVEAVEAGGIKIPFLTLTEQMIDNPNLSILVDAMLKIGLGTPLSEPGNYTLFAPNNDAFEKLPEGTMDKYMDNEWGMHLEDIVMSHLTNDNVDSKNLIDGTEVNTLNGDTMLITKDPDTKINGYISIVQSDIPASNGLMEEIDGVILPPSALLDIATYAGIVSDIDVIPYSFKSLLSLLHLADLSDYVSSTSPITLLAPHDSAIEKLDPGFVQYLSDPANKDMLVKVLQYHIIEGNKYSKNLVSGREVGTTNGDDVRFYKNIKFGQFKSNKIVVDLKATMVDSDVLANNGVIHVIDILLVPDDVQKAYNLFKSSI